MRVPTGRVDDAKIDAETTKEVLVRSRRRYLWGVYVVVAAAGAHAALAPPVQQGSDVVIHLVIGLLMSLLVVVDARIIGKPLPQSAGWLILMFWPLAAPGYVIALRKIRGVGLVLGHGALLVAIYMLVFLVLRWLTS